MKVPGLGDNKPSILAGIAQKTEGRPGEGPSPKHFPLSPVTITTVPNVLFSPMAHSACFDAPSSKPRHPWEGRAWCRHPGQCHHKPAEKSC